MHKTDFDSFYGAIGATAEYLQSTNKRRLAEYFFGSDAIIFSGSLVTSRPIDALLADYFGLSPTFDGTLCIKPKVHTSLVDFSAYFGLDNVYPGLYIRTHAPVVLTQWEVKLEETIRNDGSTTPFPAGYMTTNAINAPVKSALRPFQGDVVFGDVQEGMKFGKIDGSQTKKGISDIHFVLGWNVIRRERGHFGIYLMTAIPTGSKSCATFLFEPIVGNNHHWELGVGLSGQVLLWEKDGDQTVTIHVDANARHLFTSRQRRSFDFLCNGFGSRYILLKEFDQFGQYTQKSLPAINKTTLCCKVSVDFLIDGAFMASYRHTNWTVDCGYNGWIRTREKLRITGCIEKNRFGLKGLQGVRGVDANKTESGATVHGDVLDPAVQVATADPSPPVFIKTADLDKRSAASPFAMTHKFFGSFSYAWNNDDNQKIVPYLGVGAEWEFEGVRVEETRPNRNTLSQFGIWIKGGAAF